VVLGRVDLYSSHTRRTSVLKSSHESLHTHKERERERERERGRSWLCIIGMVIDLCILDTQAPFYSQNHNELWELIKNTEPDWDFYYHLSKTSLSLMKAVCRSFDS